MLMVLLMAPERKGWAAAIILMCAATGMKRLPFPPRPEGVAVPPGEPRLVEPELLGHVALPEDPRVEGERDVEGALQRLLHPGDAGLVEAPRQERLVVDGRGAAKGLSPDAVGDDVVDLALGVAQRAERDGQALVDDLEVAAARQLLELHEGEVGL